MKYGLLVASITLFILFIIYFVRGTMKFREIDKQEYNHHKEEDLSRIFYGTIITSASCAFMSIFGALVLIFLLLYNNNYYRVIDIYAEGVAVRCLTDDDHKTSVIPLTEEKVAKLKEFDLIDSEGNVIISGIWFGMEPEPTSADD